LTEEIGWSGLTHIRRMWVHEYLRHLPTVVGQAQLACCMAWLDPIDDGEMV